MQHEWIQPQASGATFHIKTADGRMAQAAITFEHATVVRYQLRAAGASPRPKFPLTRDPGWPAVDVHVEAGSNHARLTTPGGAVSVHVQRDPWQVSLVDAKGHVITREFPRDVDARANYQSKPTGFWAEGRIRANFELFADEHLYGFGEKFTDLDKRRQTIHLWNRNPYGSGLELAYKNIPFFVSTRGYGVFVNTTVPSHYDLGSASNFAYGIEVEEEEFDLYLIAGPAYADIFRRYHELTGLPGIPPKWAFGLWLSPLGEERAGEDVGQAAIIRIADDVRAHGIPADVMHLDPYWMTYGRLCDFEWEARYPDPAQMIQDLRARGLRVCLWEHPYVDVQSEMYREGDAKGYFLKRADGSTYVVNLVIAPGGTRKEYKEAYYDPGGIVDFSNPDAVEWYKSKHRPLLDAGVAAFKTDFGEEIPHDSHWHNGLTGHEMHNAFPLLYNKTVFDVTGEYTDRPMVWGRSAYAGIQAFPMQWSGDPLVDFPSMSGTLRGGLSYAMSGVPFWSHDLGGFKGEPSETVFVRWIQFGLFTALSRLHGTTTRLPWRFSPRVLEIFRRYAELRYRLLPYIYSTAKACVEHNLPFMRPMMLAYPDDPATYTLDQQYLFGDSFLVAPVFNDEGRVDVYLPAGTWYDLWTGEPFEGPRFVRRTVGLEEMPVYVKSESIIPYAPLRQWVEEGPWQPLTLQIWLKHHAQLTLHDDDGVTTFAARRTPDGVTITLGAKHIDGIAGDYIVQLPASEATGTVLWNGRPLSPVNTAGEEGTWMEGAFVNIRCHGGGRLELKP